VKKIPGVQQAAFSFSVAEKGNNMENYDFDGDGNNTLLNLTTVDPDYIPMMDLQLLEGENFSYDRTSGKKTAIILNETAVKEAGLKPGSAAGTIFHRDDWYLTVLPSKQCKVIGVVEDFHFRSMHEPITPLGLVCHGSVAEQLCLQDQPDARPVPAGSPPGFAHCSTHHLL